MKDKNHVERYMRGMKKQRSRSETRQLQEAARRRRADERVRRSRKRAPVDDDEELFEKMVGAKARPRPQPVAAPVEIAAASAQRPPRASCQATVLAVDRRELRVRVEGEVLVAALAPRLAQDQSVRLAVGDEVWLAGQPGQRPTAVGLLTRRSVLARPDPHHPTRELVLAANVDLALIVASVVAPPLRPRLVDRVWIALQRGGVGALLVVNKVDLATDGERSAIRESLAPYGALGLDPLFSSTATGEGVEPLRERLRGRTVVLVGHSGVGKSSLLNALDPGTERRTRSVREGDGKGRHTTTRSWMWDLGGGTRVIDTPGVRAFGVPALDRAGLERAFPEIAGLSDGCRFRDCAHAVEPDCAVRAALEAGELAAARHDVYARLARSLDE